MKASLINKLACPFDKSDLSLKVYKEDEQGDITEGIITCSVCKRYYPIVYGIPIMSPDEYREIALEQPLLERWGLQLGEKTNDNNFRLLDDGSSASLKL